MLLRRRHSIKKFHFKLETLLHLRERREHLAVGELAKVMVRYNELQSARLDSERQLNEEMVSLEQSKQVQFDIDSYRMHHLYIDRLEAEQRTAIEHQEAMLPELEKEQAKVTEARREKRIVEILKEKKKQEFDEKLRKNERKAIEESNRMLLSSKIVEPAESLHPIQTEYENGMELDDTEEHGTHPESDSTESTERKSGEDYIRDYFKKLGMEYPGDKKR